MLHFLAHPVELTAESPVQAVQPEGLHVEQLGEKSEHGVQEFVLVK